MTGTKVADSPVEVRQVARRARYSALRLLWRESQLDRVKSCRRWAHDGQGGVGVKVAGSGDQARAGFSGLVTCGSVWACPVCSASIAAHRATEVEQLLAAHTKTGGGVVLATFTVQHWRGQGLMSLWDAVSHGWGRVTSGASWGGSVSKKTGKVRLGDRDVYGIVGWIRVVEVTVGDNGWHVHVHALLLTAGRLTPADLNCLHESLYGRWLSGLNAHGFTASRAHGVDVRPVEGTGPLGRYFTKAVYELTGANLKGTRFDNVTPFGLLEQLVTTGEAEYLELWAEWETASRGRRQLTWSQGLRELYAVDPELDDQAVVELDELAGELVACIAGDSWRQVTSRGLMSRILDSAEAGRLLSTLDELGLRYEVPRGVPL